MKKLLQYEFTRKNGETKLTGVCPISEKAKELWPGNFFPNFTMYQYYCAAPANEKQPERPVTEYWYSTAEAENRMEGLTLAIDLLIKLPFTRSINQNMENISPVILPLALSKADPNLLIDKE